MKIVARAVLAAVFGLAIHASAEPRVCIGGDLDHLSAPEKNSCRANAERIRQDAARFHAPSDWHYFVICTESDWKAYAAYSRRSPAELAGLNVDTDLAGRRTFFRGAVLGTASPERFHRLIAREAASALLNSVDELAIDKQVSLWIPETYGEVAMLAENR